MSMIALLILCGFCCVGVMTCTFYGWGLFARRIMALPCGTWPTTAALGFASVIFVGGVLNLFRLAHPWAFAAIIIVGLALMAHQTWQSRASLTSGMTNMGTARGAWWLVVVLLMAFTCATQISP